MAEDTSGSGGAPRPANPARQPSGADMGWGVTGTLISGMAVWGGVGWLLDQWLDVRGFFAAGIILGVAVGVYVVVVKYGAVPSDGGRAAGNGQQRPRRGRPPRTEKGRR